MNVTRRITLAALAAGAALLWNLLRGRMSWLQE